MEFRTYTMLPGARAEFVEYFRTQAIPRMQAAGMNVLGQFSSVTDENVFAYARTFATLEEREQQYRSFYESEDWLGWMIDTAMGKEESFLVFLGDTEAPGEPRPVEELSGVHSARFTLASARGTVVQSTGRTLAVADDDHAGELVTFTVPSDVRCFFTPNGRGPDPAVSISIDAVVVGDRVLVLGAQTEDGPVARQVVKRPAVQD